MSYFVFCERSSVLRLIIFVFVIESGMNKLVNISFIIGIALLLASCNEKMPGNFVTFDNYNLHVIENGTGEPVVIFEGGLNCTTYSYDMLRIPVSKFTRTISYDHAGIGYSTESPDQRTLPVYVNELRRLLEKEMLPPPYILVGHSIGGFIVRYFAHLYPDEVAGLVFIDMPPDEWFNYIRTTHSPEDVQTFNRIFDPAITVFYEGVAKKELEMYEHNTELLKDIKIPPHISVRMLTSIRFDEFTKRNGYKPDDMAVWAQMQSEELKGVHDATQIITEKSGHYLQKTEPELIVDAVKELVEKYRNMKSDNPCQGLKSVE